MSNSFPVAGMKDVVIVTTPFMPAFLVELF
jgi:hypothetical protein